MERKLAFQKNDCIPLTVTGYTAEGRGVGRCQGAAVFVPGAAAGDVLRVRILKTEKTYAYGKIEEILSPSPDRTAPDCPQFPRCGGCVFRHITYAAECRAKEQRVRDAIGRIGGLPPQLVESIVPAQDPQRYRNKAQFPLGLAPDGGLTAGFYAPHSHRIIPCGDCLLQPESFTKAVHAVQAWYQKARDSVYDEKTGKGLLRHLYLREAMSGGEVLVCLVVNGGAVSEEELLVRLLQQQVPGLAGVLLNTNRRRTNVILGEKNRTLWGAPALTDTLCGLRFSISPNSFYQVNRAQAEVLYGIAGRFAGLTGKETLLDLYCGTGTIGLSMAKNAGHVIGVEVVPAAVADARRNAACNGIKNAEFFCGDAAQAAARLREKGLSPDVIVLDPPRKGCGPVLVHTAAQMAPQRIVYVSCDPATLARDLKTFAQEGYALCRAVPVDLFPRTAHVECVALMSRVKD
ncbi:MAG: 23S rRNA (uracil(1939)-C(5))-methyltransferase RlmD [Oscillospiraceae bacterium]|jgi:23S rRNA (uracil1939-C5)-methyltransferase|nr:23S rRNA (uracil(1939)-C(5))-methyltransferase RlmD [Oscillospiraceae bacterium]